MPETLADFFRRVTGNDILPYQQRYGEDPFQSTLVIIPTGLGKTQAVIVPWLHAIATARPGTPHRLVFMLPRRNLTEQTTRVARRLIQEASLTEQIDVRELMGSSSDNK